MYLYNSAAVRFTGVLLRPSCASGMHDDDAVGVSLLPILVSLDRKWHLKEVPIRQCIAVTGSVNQHRAIGGVNEKIEGFFDVCKARGLSGEHGVLIPASNVKHLMLRQEIVDAAAAGKIFTFTRWKRSTKASRF